VDSQRYFGALGREALRAQLRLAVAYRKPPKLGERDMRDGSLIAERDTCGDAGDIFLDEKRRRFALGSG
jgi:hypothetical protein